VLFCGDSSIHRWTTGASSSIKLENKQWPSGVRDLAANESGEWVTILAKDGREGQVQCWELDDDGELCLKWSKKEPHCKSLSVSADQRLVACLVGDNTIRVFDGMTGKTLKTLTPQKSPWTCLAFVPQLNCLATGSKDGALTYYDTRTWQQQACVHLEPSAIQSISVSPGCRKLGVRHANGHAGLAPLSIATPVAEVSVYGAADAGAIPSFWFEPVQMWIHR